MTDTATPQVVDYALLYASRGWRVFPLKPRGKTPLVKGGFKAATVDPNQIRAWWQQWPTANIGIATGRASGLLVFDIDGKPGLDELAKLTRLHGPIPSTPVVVTSRGWHIYLALPQGDAGRIPCSSGDGLDVRGDGGYVVAPPSVHESGHVYYWANELRDDGTNPPPVMVLV